MLAVKPRANPHAAANKNGSPKLSPEVTKQLRALAHDLSNSLETILQASYLLGQAQLDANPRRWTQVIDKAAEDAARINREIREILRSQG